MTKSIHCQWILLLPNLEMSSKVAWVGWWYTSIMEIAEQPDTYLEGVFGPGVITNHDAKEATRLAVEEGPTYIDRTDGDFFSRDAFRQLILCKVVKE